jgi:hypothetical protein
MFHQKLGVYFRDNSLLISVVYEWCTAQRDVCDMVGLLSEECSALRDFYHIVLSPIATNTSPSCE